MYLNGEDLNISVRIFRCETPYARNFGCENWFTYLQIFLKNPYNMYGLYIRMGIPVDVRLSVHTCDCHL